MSISMIRGYGLPSEGASSYNGYGQLRGYGAPRRRTAADLFRPLPDPELGDYRGFGDFGTTEFTSKQLHAAMGPMPAEHSLPTQPAATPGPNPSTNAGAGAGGGGGGGLGGLPMLPIVLGVGAIALFFIMKKG